MKTEVMEPKRLVIMETEAEDEEAAGRIQDTEVSDCHEAVRQTTPPTNMLGVKSMVAKLIPDTVKLVRPDWGEL